MVVVARSTLLGYATHYSESWSYSVQNTPVLESILLTSKQIIL